MGYAGSETRAPRSVEMFPTRIAHSGRLFSPIMSIVVTGSIAFDYLMSFPGKFTEHFLPEHMSRVSLSFLVDSMDKRRGGCAPNIAYTLALLGERPRLMGTAGQDFDDYRRWLEAAGVDTSLVKQIPDKFTASFFCSTDVESNQIASFYTGAMANAAELSFRTVTDCELAIISPNDPSAMLQYAEECRTLRVPFVWDPGQQCARMSGDELRDGLNSSFAVISNDYEFELIRQKTGLDERGVLQRSRALVITRGEAGSTVFQGEHTVDVPAVPPHRIVDPTGVGDAFRGGLLKGIVAAGDLEVGARLGSVAAAYVLEHLGGQSHAYTWEEFRDRYAAHFGAPPHSVAPSAVSQKSR
jgi:adenosine kinase